jgi:hypothetical protein
MKAITKLRRPVKIDTYSKINIAQPYCTSLLRIVAIVISLLPFFLTNKSYANLITVTFNYKNSLMTITGTVPWCCGGDDVTYYDFSKSASPFATGKFLGTSTSLSDFTDDTGYSDSLSLWAFSPGSKIPYDIWYFDTPSFLSAYGTSPLSGNIVTTTVESVSEGGPNPIPSPSALWLLITALFLFSLFKRVACRFSGRGATITILGHCSVGRPLVPPSSHFVRGHALPKRLIWRGLRP